MFPSTLPSFGSSRDDLSNFSLPSELLLALHCLPTTPCFCPANSVFLSKSLSKRTPVSLPYLPALPCHLPPSPTQNSKLSISLPSKITLPLYLPAPSNSFSSLPCPQEPQSLYLLSQSLSSCSKLFLSPPLPSSPLPPCPQTLSPPLPPASNSFSPLPPCRSSKTLPPQNLSLLSLPQNSFSPSLPALKTLSPPPPALKSFSPSPPCLKTLFLLLLPSKSFFPSLSPHSFSPLSPVLKLSLSLSLPQNSSSPTSCPIPCLFCLKLFPCKRTRPSWPSSLSPPQLSSLYLCPQSFLSPTVLPQTCSPLPPCLNLSLLPPCLNSLSPLTPALTTHFSPSSLSQTISLPNLSLASKFTVSSSLPPPQTLSLPPSLSQNYFSPYSCPQNYSHLSSCSKLSSCPTPAPQNSPPTSLHFSLSSCPTYPAALLHFPCHARPLPPHKEQGA
ncbi:hypothetical protein C7M84_003524 [Penaeus vannamei]|uniref:Uncharacterized protein n=1 Tax=Penaeus vannamei TaxID=6689 RepID=A0A3R7QG41_PENVA|nr:hypothetical protein C7M84_003524 [Penaeus vannamei]